MEHITLLIGFFAERLANFDHMLSCVEGARQGRAGARPSVLWAPREDARVYVCACACMCGDKCIGTKSHS